MSTAGALRVSAPASSGNLGPGFDCLGLALSLRNELLVTPGRGAVTVEGEGAGTVPTDGTNLVAEAFDSVAPGLREQWDLHCVNRIPLARGLGSSTAAAALGLAAASALLGDDLDRAALFVKLTQFDGHADNAGPCVYGGLTATQPHLLHLTPPAWLAPLVAVPGREVPTAAARAVLPGTYAREAVVTAVGAAATLGAALAVGDLEAVAACLAVDTVHEPYRAQLVPELEIVREAIAGSPALGATLSGAGPSVLVWCTPDSRVAVGAVVAAALGVDVPVWALDVDARGVAIES